MKTACLLCGGPGVGKTTVIREAVARLKLSAGGFYTAEIRVQGSRQGFEIITLDGKSAILAHVSIRSPYRVSKYGVDVEALDRVGVAALRQAIEGCDLVVVDEIGKMELFSASFKEAVLEALSSGKRLLGTIMLSPHPWADQIKRHPRASLISITRLNWQQALEQVMSWLSAAGQDCIG